MNTFANGKFVYDTFVGTDKVEITLDLTHPEIRSMVNAAIAGKTGKIRRANGALVVRVVAR